MKIRRHTRYAVRFYLPRFRAADDVAVRLYEKHAADLYYARTAYIIERICRSELRRRGL